MDSLLKVYPSTSIVIAVHNNDPMVDLTNNSAYDNSMQSFPGFPGVPSIIVDRQVAADPQQALLFYTFYTNSFGYADISVTPSFNTLNRLAVVTATAHFAVNLSGDYRLACVFTEDDVTGSGSGYAQQNFYAGGAYGPMGG